MGRWGPSANRWMQYNCTQICIMIEIYIPQLNSVKCLSDMRIMHLVCTLLCFTVFWYQWIATHDRFTMKPKRYARGSHFVVFCCVWYWSVLAIFFRINWTHESILLIVIFRSCHDDALWWMPQDLTDDKSTLVQVMAWCHQATSHYLSQCWLSSLSPYGVTRPPWVK